MEEVQAWGSMRSISRVEHWVRSSTSRKSCHVDDEEALMWSALEKLPTYDRLRTTILKKVGDNGEVTAKEIDVTKMGYAERQDLIERVLRGSEEEHQRFLTRLRQRIDRVGIEPPKIEVRFEHLNVQTEGHVGNRALPTLKNFTLDVLQSLLSLVGLKASKQTTITILRDISGIVKPSRLTLLLGPPGSGKTTLLLALCGKLPGRLKISGRVTYNGHDMHEFVPQKTAAYISQHDHHMGELTVRETLDFSGRCQGVGMRFELLKELLRREKEAGIQPEADIDLFMKASSQEGQQNSVVTDYIMTILGLQSCADIIVGDEMRRGISGGQRKRVTTGEMLVGPANALFMDEISTGLDSATTYQIVRSLRDSVHVMDTTMLVSLLQPPPETFELFDDMILISEGQIVYQGLRTEVLGFFETLGFKCPERKGVCDFLQEVTSRKDQEQYWAFNSQPYHYVSVHQFAEAFHKFHLGQLIQDQLLIPFDKSKSHPAALVHVRFALSNWEVFKVCYARDKILLKRNVVVYVFKSVQIAVIALITCTVFFRTTLKTNFQDGILYLGALYFAILNFMINCFSELALILPRLPVFYKQRDLLLYPAWAFSVPNVILKIPISFLEAGIWVIITYFVIGFSADASRFFRMYLLLVCLNQMYLGMFRLVGGIGRGPLLAQTLGSLTILFSVTLGGFVISRQSIQPWWIWGYWTSPLMWAQNAISTNEFLSKRWSEPFIPADPSLGTLGENILTTRGLFKDAYWYWLGTGVLAVYAISCNILFTLSLKYLNPLGKPNTSVPDGKINVATADEGESFTHAKNAFLTSRTMEGMSKRQTIPRSLVGTLGASDINSLEHLDDPELGPNLSSAPKKGMILPFRPLSMAFSHINYYVNMPLAMKQQGIVQDKLQLLSDISGVLRPGVLTALMGVSGAGKTTLMDVLAGRKTGGYIEGSINISGYPKNQSTFARIAGYCEQNDIHSPNVTVHESLIFSALMRLPDSVNKETRMIFVEEVMNLVELNSLRNALVGLPGVTGLSVEQRKRLTMAVELVANPSIIFLDEPTSGLDARAAAIVMRTVRNTVDTGRTVLCTIHQPSIDIFEAFDELLLMKRGGRVIYGGPLGHQSYKLIEHFEAIPGVPRIEHGVNPATWMLEISSSSTEARLGIDFADVFQESSLFQHNLELIKELSMIASRSSDLYFPRAYAQPFLVQLYACYWKMNLSYWRNPLYNIVRIAFTSVASFIYGGVFWAVGSKRSTQQEVFNFMGAMYASLIFMGINNSSSAQPVISTERTAYYREQAAGMYSPMAYAFAQLSVEWPYILIQTIIYTATVYSMSQLEWTPVKFLWFFYFIYFSLLCFTYWGMMCVALTPNPQLAVILSTAFYGLWNLFSGFSIARPQIPVWWRWYVWLSPTSWTLYGTTVAQLGDITTPIQVPGVNGTFTVKSYLSDHFGWDHSFLPWLAVEHIGISVLLGFAFAVSIKKLNFQNR